MKCSKDVRVSDLPLITDAYLTITQNCNLACKYCFVLKKPKKMSLRIAIDSADFLAKNAKVSNSRPSIVFFGGEPLLEWEDVVKPLILYIRQKYGGDFSLSLTTNGTLLDEEKLSLMVRNKVGLLFSMDGDKKTQNNNRKFRNGSSSFEVLKEKFDIIHQYYPFITFRSTTDNDNTNEFVENYKFAVENGFKSVFNTVNVFAEWTEKQQEDLKLQVNKLGEYYYDLIKNGSEVIFSPLNRMFNKLKFIEKTVKLGKYRNVAEELLANGRCGLGADSSVGIDTDGYIYSCHMMSGNDTLGDKFRIGHIYKGANNEKRMELAKIYSMKDVVSQGGKEFCKKCKLYPVCDGSCLINNYMLSGDVHIMPKILCIYYQALIKAAKTIIERAEKDDNNEFFKKRRIID